MKYLLPLLLMVTTLACNNEKRSNYELYHEALAVAGDISPNFYDENIPQDYESEFEEIETPRNAEPPPPPQFINTQLSSVDKKLVRTASIEIKVENYKTARAELNNLLQKYKVEVNNESQNRMQEGYRYNLQLRVLPKDFEAFLGGIEKMANFIYRKDVQVQDVTRQYVDLETRLASKRAVIAQYRELLKDAKSVTDVLAVSEKLNEIAEEMESNEAQLRVLKDQVQLCTIDLAIFDEFLLPDVAQKNFWNRIGEGLFNGWNILLSIIIGLVTAWPVVLIVTAILWLGRKAWKRRKERKATVS